MAQLLCERGADLAAADLDGRTALHFASVNGHLEARCLARNASDSPETACLARAVRRLLSRGAVRALLLASARPSLPWQVTRWLVGEGVAADSRDAMGRRAHDDTVKHSLSMTDDFTCSCWGRRALDYACFSGHTAVARYLCGLASGACRTETELRLVLRHPRLKLEQYTERRTAPRRAEMRGDAPRCAELRRDAPSCAEMSHTERRRHVCSLARLGLSHPHAVGFLPVPWPWREGEGSPSTRPTRSVWRRSPCLRLVEGGYCISALQRLAATELRAVGIEGGAMKQGHAARLAKHFHEAVEEVAGSAVASLGEGIFTGFSGSLELSYV